MDFGFAPIRFPFRFDGLVSFFLVEDGFGKKCWRSMGDAYGETNVSNALHISSFSPTGTFFLPLALFPRKENLPYQKNSPRPLSHNQPANPTSMRARYSIYAAITTIVTNHYRPRRDAKELDARKALTRSLRVLAQGRDL